jgi:hypothetical protein
MAERVLACIGNNDRLNILLKILQKPMTVVQLVEACGFGSTGQAYHLLKPLIAADLVVEDGKKRGQGRLHYPAPPGAGHSHAALGISDMLDPQYTRHLGRAGIILEKPDRPGYNVGGGTLCSLGMQS